MLSFTELLQQGTAHAWLFIPSAILLGALHGLEPGHSKTMMAAFIVAIRGSVGQAVLLGLMATISHTLVVWTIALGGMYLWRGMNVEQLEPYFQLCSGMIIVVIALWMIWRTWKDRQSAYAAGHRSHGHTHAEHDGHDHHHDHVHGEADHIALTEGYQDAHERAHANDIQRRFAGRTATNGQIALFGLTGGLIPCPAAITVLLLCLQLKAFTLGATLVLSFSLGLALTLVTVGVLAAVSLRQASRRFTWFSTVASKAPFFSGALILMVGVYLAILGWRSIGQ